MSGDGVRHGHRAALWIEAAIEEFGLDPVVIGEPFDVPEVLSCGPGVGGPWWFRPRGLPRPCVR